MTEPKELICPICQKPIKPGESATRTNGSIVHIACYGKKPVKNA